MEGYNEEWHEKIRKIKENIIYMRITEEGLKKPYKYVVYEMDCRFYAWCLDVNIRRESRDRETVERYMKEALKALLEESR